MSSRQPAIASPLPAPFLDFAPARVPRDAGVVQEVWALLRRRWRMIAGTVAVLVAATLVYWLFATRWYRAQTTVLIEARAPELVNGQRVGDQQDAFLSLKYDYYQTQYTLLMSRGLAERVIAELGLAQDTRFTWPLTPDDHGNFTDNAIVTEYFRRLYVVPVRGTRLVQIGFDNVSPELSARIANTHARLFVSSGLERIYGGMDQIRAFLESKVGDVQARLSAAENDLMQFQSAHNLLPVDLSKDVGSERLMDLSRRLTAAQADAIALEAQHQLVAEGNTDSLPAVLQNQLIQRLREEYSRLGVDAALLAEKFTSEFPGRKQVEGQLAHARQLLDAETGKVVRGVEASFHAAQRTVDQLQTQLDAQRSQLVNRKDDEGQLLTKMREVDLTRSLYDNLIARVKDLNLTAGADASNINIVEAATPPALPSWPSLLLLGALGMATSFLLGTGLALVRDGFDRTIQDADDLRRMTGVGPLAIIPDLDRPPGTVRDRISWHATRAQRVALAGWRRIGGFALPNGNGNGNGNGHRHHHGRSNGASRVSTAVVHDGHLAPLAEAYRTLRSALLLSAATGPPRVVVITSPTGGSGKTSTAVNTALALAACGANVLLIDGDMRLARCHRALGVPREPGLSDVLLGLDETQAIRTTSIEYLSFLPAGRRVPSPTELISSARMARLVQQARERFDYVIIDSPPLLAVSDGLLLGRLADGALLITEKGRTRREEARLALERLRETGAAPLGVVLNRGSLDHDYYRYTRALDAAAEG